MINLEELERLRLDVAKYRWEFGDLYFSSSWNQKSADAFHKYMIATLTAAPDLIKEFRELEEHTAYLETVNADLIAEMNGYMAKVADLERELKAALERV